MNKVIIHRADNTPSMVVKEDGKYRVKTCNGTTYVLPSDVRKIAEDLLEFSNIFSDEEIVDINDALIHREFSRR